VRREIVIASLAALLTGVGWAAETRPVRPQEGDVSLEKTAAKLKAKRPVTIVCLGDSVTGIYYHTGGRRAYPEMIPLAIRKVYPQAAVTGVNAGISGNSTVDGLKRLQKDVLDRKPDLVTVMFGLNDMVRVPLAEFRANLGQIIRQCRRSGAEVLLCTPNSVIDTPGRPRAKLVDYCDAIREVARRQQVPVCDIHAAYEAIRARDRLVWRLLLSDEIHPNMDGHKLNAEEICRSIAGHAVSLRPAGPPQPAIPKTLALLKAGKPVRVLAMPPYDRLIGPAFQALVPTARIEVTGWPTVGRTLAQIEEAAKKVRATPPDLVLVAVPAAVTPGAEAPPEEAIRAYSWVLNWSLSFGQQEWDVVGIAPSVLQVNLTPDEKSRDEFARCRILAQDLSLIARPNNDPSPPERILENWLRRQLSALSAGNTADEPAAVTLENRRGRRRLSFDHARPCAGPRALPEPCLLGSARRDARPRQGPVGRFRAVP
jgi:acyl-CoA thioesterase I